MYLIGYDIGSSSVKAALVDADTGKKVSVVQQPLKEMAIHAPEPGWAEQHPDTWWRHICNATKQLLSENGISGSDIKSIGIAYQMHGLVMVSGDGDVLRPSIIWCDSRAVGVGQRAFDQIGHEICLRHMLNSPGNFTASKLRWVFENEPEIFQDCAKIMLPGDYIAYKLSGEIQTTPSGLSEGVLWDFQMNQPAKILMDHYEFDSTILPEIVPSVGLQCKVSALAAEQTGLRLGTPIAYRAGDQPNNAMSLNVLESGEVAATGGTSGVVYGVVDRPIYDPASRVNGFAHVNHSVEKPRIGILLCINGAGIQYGWIRKMIATSTPYSTLEQRAAKVSIGSDGLCVIPFGNGAERIFESKDIGSHLCHLQLNRHRQEHLIRATLEGIAFAFVYGMDILKEMGLDTGVMKVGNDNLFQSAIFSKTIATLTGASIKMIDTTGAVGAALASGVGVLHFSGFAEAMAQLQIIDEVSPDIANREVYLEAYTKWKTSLDGKLEKS
ncbi:MAG: carbohydrate kinase [Saprospiraceae bacterium]|nr:carbohydrate kinase [Saprospiraceae bacterium]